MSEHLPPIFDGLDEAQLDAALRHFRRLDVDYGVQLMEEGDEDPSLICILDGQVEVKTGGVELAKVGPGEIIGEMALFGSGLRTASVKSTSGCSFLMLDRVNYETLRDTGNPVAKAIEEQALATLTARLRDINRRIGRIAEGTAAANVTPGATLFNRVARLFGGSGGRMPTFGVDKAGALKKSALFADAAPGALEELAGLMSQLSCSTGTFLCTQGEYGQEMFVLVEGLVEVIATLDEEKGVENLATLDPGDVFGMASLVEDLPRMASCVTRGKVICLSLDRGTFKKVTTENRPAGSLLRTSLIKGLVDQVAFANGQLAMLDIEKKRKTGQVLVPLLRAKGGMEAHGKHLQESEEG